MDNISDVALSLNYKQIYINHNKMFVFLNSYILFSSVLTIVYYTIYNIHTFKTYHLNCTVYITTMSIKNTFKILIICICIKQILDKCEVDQHI